MSTETETKQWLLPDEVLTCVLCNAPLKLIKTDEKGLLYYECGSTISIHYEFTGGHRDDS